MFNNWEAVKGTVCDPEENSLEMKTSVANLRLHVHRPVYKLLGWGNFQRLRIFFFLSLSTFYFQCLQNTEVINNITNMNISTLYLPYKVIHRKEYD
jgi:hypothetical protein